MARTRYVRVKLKTGSPFWAVVEAKRKGFTLYLKVNKEGADRSYYSAKRKAYVIPKHLIANSLIVSEKPAIERLLYGWLVLDTPKNRKINADIVAEYRRKKR